MAHKRRALRLVLPASIVAGALFAGRPFPATATVGQDCVLDVLGRDACSHGCDPTFAPGTRYGQTLERLAAYLDTAARREPHALLILGVIDRWFGGARYADALAHYDSAIQADPQKAPVLRVYRRILAADSPLDPRDYSQVYKDVDVVTAPAMFCDRQELPAGYTAKLLEAREGGGYLLTHAALAWMWIGENGCTLELPAGFGAGLIDAVAGLIGQSQGITDLEIEAAALLHAMGHGRRVPPGFIDRVLAAQLPNGGYREDSTSGEVASWHTSVLAFWLLLQQACPSALPRAMLAPPAAGS